MNSSTLKTAHLFLLHQVQCLQTQVLHKGEGLSIAHCMPLDIEVCKLGVWRHFFTCPLAGVSCTLVRRDLHPTLRQQSVSSCTKNPVKFCSVFIRSVMASRAMRVYPGQQQATSAENVMACMGAGTHPYEEDCGDHPAEEAYDHSGQHLSGRYISLHVARNEHMGARTTGIARPCVSTGRRG